MSTISKNTTLALNGSAGFKTGAEALSWSSRWIDTITLSSGTSKSALTATTPLSGSAWAIKNLIFSPDNNLVARITDVDGAAGRYIENIALGSSSIVRLLSTGVGTMTGSNSVDNIVTGSAYVGKIDLSGGHNTLIVGSGGAGSVFAGEGNDRITTGAGWVGMISAGSGNNIITTGSAYVTDIVALFGNDMIALGAGGGRSIDAGEGANIIATQGYVGSVTGGSGVDTIRIGAGGAGQIAAGEGTNGISTSSGYVERIQAGAGADVIAIGSGGAGFVDAGSGANRITTETGWVSTIQTLGGNDTITVGAGGAGDIRAGDGANRITTGSGWITSILTGSGNDMFVLGSGGIGLVESGAGADTFILNEFKSTSYASLNCGVDGAMDTLDVSRYSHGLTLSLDTPTTWQSLGLGGVYLANLDRIIGTGFDDVLLGSSSGANINNVLVGGGGNDRLEGGAGADRLHGGSGLDHLFGGSGADVFEFHFAQDSALGGNRDVIADFSHAERDRVDLRLIDANLALAGDQAFRYFDDGAYHANGLWFKDHVLYGDVDGKSGADFEIEIAGVSSLAAGDFLL